MIWFTRSRDWSAEQSARAISRSGIELPEVLPNPGWMKNTPFSVELSSEQFPGASPVWIWEE